MVELIGKKALSEEIESLTVHVTGLRAGKGVLSKFMEEYRNSVLRIIDEQPTTTEAEIRAKAINEFAEKLHDLCGVEIGEYQYTDLLHESWIDEIAEQLKGE